MITDFTQLEEKVWFQNFQSFQKQGITTLFEFGDGGIFVNALMEDRICTLSPELSGQRVLNGITIHFPALQIIQWQFGLGKDIYIGMQVWKRFNQTIGATNIYEDDNRYELVSWTEHMNKTRITALLASNT